MLEDYIKKGIVPIRTLHGSLQKWADEYGDRTAVVDCSSRVTYKELNQRANAVGLQLKNNGIKPKDLVVLWMNNRVEFLYSFFGLMKIGALPVLLLPSQRGKELSIISDFSEASAIICYGKDLGYDYTSEAISYSDSKGENQVKVFSFVKQEGTVHLNPYSDTEADFPDDTHETAAEDALYLLSGGTTGIPKLIPKKHSAYLYNAQYSAKRCNVNKDSVYLCVLSIAHDFPLSSPGILGTLMNGGTCVLSMTASFDEVSDWISNEKVTFTQAAPAVISTWLECMEWEEDFDITSMKYIIIGAAKLDFQLAKKIEETFGAVIIQGYGLGEGITCFTSPDDDKEVSWKTVGTPISEYDEIKIMDQNGIELPPLEAGELWEKGPYTFEGYYKADEMNKELFTSDGFFKTGDKAMITKEGKVVILGRVREQINRGGENVIPSEIETYLRKVEGINDAAVFGIPDDELGEKICAVIIEEDSAITDENIRKELTKMGLASYKLPDCIERTEQFPFINVGKVDKKKLLQDIRRRKNA